MAAASTPTPAIPSHMKAWAYSKRGKITDVLKFNPNLPIPELKVDQVLIKVVAAAINPIDSAKIEGRYNDVDASFPVRHSSFFCFYSVYMMKLMFFTINFLELFNTLEF